MNEFVSFFKEIFMISDENSKVKIGLSQFKSVEELSEKVTKKVEKVQKDVKLSDLMRRSA